VASIVRPMLQEMRPRDTDSMPTAGHGGPGLGGDMRTRKAEPRERCGSDRSREPSRCQDKAELGATGLRSPLLARGDSRRGGIRSSTMGALSEAVVERFADLCHGAHRSWATWRALSDGVHFSGDFSKGMSRAAATGYSMVCAACLEHAVMQIAKLHDPVSVQGNITLGVEFVARYGGWDQGVRDRLDVLLKDLRALVEPLRTNLRNKLLAHNDLASVLAGGEVVVFERGKDERYFELLWDFLNIVYGEVKGGSIMRSDEPRVCGEALAKWLSRDR
jgi:hypothetical protein